MNRALAGTLSTPTKKTKPAWASAWRKKEDNGTLDIAFISAPAFEINLKREDVELGSISLYELDRIIEDKREKDPLEGDNQETRDLIATKLPEALRPWTDALKEANRTQVLLPPELLSPDIAAELRALLENAAQQPELAVGSLTPEEELQGYLLVEKVLRLNRDPATASLAPMRTLAAEGRERWKIQDDGLLTMGGKLVVPEEDNLRTMLNRTEAQRMAQGIHEAWEIARGNMEVAQARHRKYANRRRRPDDLKVGDKVFVDVSHWKTDNANKLQQPWAGPWPITGAGLGGTWIVELPAGSKAHPVFHPSKLRKAAEDPLPGQHQDPPPPVHYGTDEPEYEVSRLLRSRVWRGKLQYQADWKGYDDDPTWYDAESFRHAPTALQAFHKQHPTAAGPPRNLSSWMEAAASDSPALPQADDNAVAALTVMNLSVNTND
ncbi:hypothetical protein HER10_EVM0000027 [Colletotrichum scovillei]|uniref:uncharacterized protein n=1 Tax=Colletotrichum scovillei TaxID=1209932 RepID=UPI0015C400FD|nr:uncharacterized protein HER10_EVM0000027 [Colletotrichum scovillei]KAF4772998.1 hypothetical protein HER10_EVM0000027 [Colletotrichum scovillei]